MVKWPVSCLVCLCISCTCYGSKNLTTPDTTGYSFALARAKIGYTLAESMLKKPKMSYGTCNQLFKHWFSCSEYLKTAVSAKNIDTIIKLMGTIAIYVTETGDLSSNKPTDILAQKCLQFAQTGADWIKFSPSGLDGPTKELYQEIYKNNG